MRWFALLLFAVTTSANAGLITERFIVTADFTGVSAPIDPVIIDFTITLDTSADILPTTGGLVVNSFNVDFTTLTDWSYRASDGLLQVGGSGTINSLSSTTFLNSLTLLVTGVGLGGDPSFRFMGYNPPNGSAFTTFIGSVTSRAESVPVPATLALFVFGLAGLGLSRRKKA